MEQTNTYHEKDRNFKGKPLSLRRALSFLGGTQAAGFRWPEME